MAISEKYDNLDGLDLASNDVTRSPFSAKELTNFVPRLDGGHECRKGSQVKAIDTGGLGLGTYEKANTTTGAITDEIITIGKTAYILKSGTLTITNSNTAALVVSIEVVNDDKSTDNGYGLDGYGETGYGTPEGDKIICRIMKDNIEQIETDLGKGFDAGAVITVASLSSTIGAISNVTSATTGTATVPAATIDITDKLVITNGNTGTLNFKYWEALNTTVTNPFNAADTNRNNDDFDNVSFANMQNVLYIGSKYVALHKYDGQTVYRAGLPNVIAATIGLNAGSLTGTYLYKVVHKQLDAAGNTRRGTISVASASTSPSSQDVTLTIANIQNGSGYNTNHALASSGQTVASSGGTVTIAVDDGSGGDHSLKAGDTAYFLNSHASVNTYKAYAVASVTTTTVVLTTTDTITVTNNLVMSNNLRTEIYRVKTGGTTDYFLVADIPNDATGATQTYVDSTADASLGAQLSAQPKDHDLPPTGGALAVHQQHLFIGLIPTDVRGVSYSVVGQPEAFPSEQNNFETSVGKGVVRGLASSDGALFIGKNKSILTAIGDFTTDNIQVDKVSSSIGLESHSSIAESEDGLFFLSRDGVYFYADGSLSSFNPNPDNPRDLSVSWPIRPKFTNLSATASKKFILSRAVGVDFPEFGQYILFVPAEGTVNNNYANANSEVFVFDYRVKKWTSWESVNMAGGAVLVDDRLWFEERRYSTFSGAVESNLHRQHKDRVDHDYHDHTVPVAQTWVSGSESAGADSSLKKWLWYRVFNTSNSDLDVVSDFTWVATIDKDFIDGSIAQTQTIAFTATGTGYGLDPYGTGPYGGARIPSVKKKIRNGKARALRFKLVNSDAVNAILSGIEVYIGTPYKSDMRE